VRRTLTARHEAQRLHNSRRRARANGRKCDPPRMKREAAGRDEKGKRKNSRRAAKHRGPREQARKAGRRKGSYVFRNAKKKDRHGYVTGGAEGEVGDRSQAPRGYAENHEECSSPQLSCRTLQGQTETGRKRNGGGGKKTPSRSSPGPRANAERILAHWLLKKPASQNAMEN